MELISPKCFKLMFAFILQDFMYILKSAFDSKVIEVISITVIIINSI